MTTEGDDTEPNKQREGAAWFHRRKSVQYKIINLLARISAGKIRSPSIRATEELYRSKDAEENAECRLPPDQHLQTEGIWAVEAYTPASIGKLLKGLESLKPAARSPNHDPAAWLRKQRNNPGSSFELYLCPPDSKFRITGFHVDMPGFASMATGTIWSATSSLTLVTMFFIPTSDEQKRLEGILRADHPTQIIPHGVGGASISHPELERRRLIAEARADWSSQASEWFATRFPGLLALDSRGVPTCELTVADGIVPFPKSPENQHDGKTLTALKWKYSDVFVPADQPDGGFFYAPFGGWDEGKIRHSIIAMTRRAFESENTDGWGSDDDRFIYPFDRSFRPIIAQWAITRVLIYYRNQIAATRDMFADIVGRQRVTRALGHVRRQTAECADAATVARDIVAGISSHSLTVYHAGMTLRKERETDDNRRMDIVLRETLTRRGGDLAADVVDLNETLHAQAALISAHANLRLQPWIILLAIVSTIAGGIAAITPAREILGWQVSKPTLSSAAPVTLSGGPSKELGPKLDREADHSE